MISSVEGTFFLN